MRSVLVLLFFISSFSFVLSQAVSDSVYLKEITVNAYFKKRNLLFIPSTVSVLDSAVMGSQNETSLVNVANTVPGVRMEERSPGSYRLSIRGSLLRSPFGIRNVKIYADEFPLTDATGNTYLNLIDVSAIRGMEIMRGPDGSMFGANSGGVIRLKLFPEDSTRVNAFAGLGTYRTFHEYSCLQHIRPINTLSITRSWQRTDGYRENSGLDRKFFQITNSFRYLPGAELRFLFIYSNIQYSTPGGLTLSQYNEKPEQARPPTVFLPGASQQQAGVNNSTFYAGILNKIALTQRWSVVISAFGSDTRFQNPFITTFEERKERNAGMRWWVENEFNINRITSTWNMGMEFQKNTSGIINYGNNIGTKDTLQNEARFNVLNGFIFSGISTEISKRVVIDLSLSYNINEYSFNNLLDSIREEKNTFSPVFMPRAAVSVVLVKGLVWRGIVSKGYSPPTLAELYASGNVLNADLQPEHGMNYETGFRFHSNRRRLFMDLTVFYYELHNAIVRRQDETGNEFFVNAGGTRQYGLEFQAKAEIIKDKPTGFIRQLFLNTSYTGYYFLFDEYIWNEMDFSRNLVTGVPSHVSVTGITAFIPFGMYVSTQYNYTSTIPLNDANTAFASEYHLIQFKAGWKYVGHPKYKFEIYAGIDNLLDEKYSLGNDLNAVGERYYNAAAPRNYFLGVHLFIK